MTHKRANYQGQRSLGKKAKVKTEGQTNRPMDTTNASSNNHINKKVATK